MIDRKEAGDGSVHPVPKEKVGEGGRGHAEGEQDADDEHSRSSDCQCGEWGRWL